MEYLSFQPENWQTKLNYSEHAKGLMALTVLAPMAIASEFIEIGSAAKLLPQFLRGHLFDGFGGLTQSALNKMVFGQGIKSNVAAGFITNSIIEVYQKFNIIPGTFDWWDFAAYAAGALAFGLYDQSAKALYDSGVTKPIYKALGIQDRRLN
jgi:hypothetical protein